MNRLFRYNTQSFSETLCALNELNPDIILHCDSPMHFGREYQLKIAEVILNDIYSHLTDIEISQVSGRLILRSQNKLEPEVVTKGIVLAFSIKNCTSKGINELSKLMTKAYTRPSDETFIGGNIDWSQWHIVNGHTLRQVCMDIDALIDKSECKNLELFERPLDWLHFDNNGIDMGDMGEVVKFFGPLPKSLGPLVESPLIK